MHSNDHGAPRYQRPQLHRFGTFREITRQGFSGNADGGLILAADGTSTPAGRDAFQGGTR